MSPGETRSGVRRRLAAISAALALLIYGALGGASASAQDKWFENGRPAKPDPSIASSPRGFAVRQIATLDGEGLASRWSQPTPGVTLDTASKVRRNQPIFTFIIFTGCKANAAGSCNITADFKLIDPQGKLWDEQKNMTVWAGPPPARGILQLSATYLGTVVEDKDPLGPYRVQAAVTDQVAGISLHTEQVLTVANEQPGS